MQPPQSPCAQVYSLHHDAQKVPASTVVQVAQVLQSAAGATAVPHVSDASTRTRRDGEQWNWLGERKQRRGAMRTLVAPALALGVGHASRHSNEQERDEPHVQQTNVGGQGR